MSHSQQLPTPILFFDHTAALGGGEIALLNLVTQIDRKRFEPVVVLASDGPLRERLSAAGVETHIIPLSEAVTDIRKDSLAGPRNVSAQQVLHIIRFIWHLRTFARRRGVRIFHTNSLKADIIGVFAGRLSGIPVIWHVRDRIADDYLPPRTTSIFRLLCRFLPNYVVANSKSTLESLRLPKSRGKKIIYSGVVHDGLPYAAIDSKHIEMPERACIGIVGRISPWKGQDVFLKAAAIVREKYPDARFQIIGAPLFGEETYEAELHQLAAELGLGENLEWLGFRSDVMDLVSQMTMLVHASKTGEPFGQVIVEAMMAGRPVVATRGGGVPEIVLDGQTGLLVPMNDVEAMAAAILQLLDDSEAAQAIGLAGRKHAIENFTIGHTVEKVVRLYEEILRFRRVRQRQQLILGAWMLFVSLGVYVYRLRSRSNAK